MKAFQEHVKEAAILKKRPHMYQAKKMDDARGLLSQTITHAGTNERSYIDSSIQIHSSFRIQSTEANRQQ
jgi:hypothetical protein